MTYVVTDACIRCKFMDCVAVCPVQCFYEGANMLVIDPVDCIDCGVCTAECPEDAIHSDVEPGMERWIELNATYAKIWPNITQPGSPPADADSYRGQEGKFERFFAENLAETLPG